MFGEENVTVLPTDGILNQGNSDPTAFPQTSKHIPNFAWNPNLDVEDVIDSCIGDLSNSDVRWKGTGEEFFKQEMLKNLKEGVCKGDEAEDINGSEKPVSEILKVLRRVIVEELWQDPRKSKIPVSSRWLYNDLEDLDIDSEIDDEAIVERGKELAIHEKNGTEPPPVKKKDSNEESSTSFSSLYVCMPNCSLPPCTKITKSQDNKFPRTSSSFDRDDSSSLELPPMGETMGGSNANASRSNSNSVVFTERDDASVSVDSPPLNLMSLDERDLPPPTVLGASSLNWSTSNVIEGTSKVHIRQAKNKWHSTVSWPNSLYGNQDWFFDLVSVSYKKESRFDHVTNKTRPRKSKSKRLADRWKRSHRLQAVLDSMQETEWKGMKKILDVNAGNAVAPPTKFDTPARKKLLVIAHSFGSSVILQLIKKYGFRPDKLLLLNPPIYPGQCFYGNDLLTVVVAEKDEEDRVAKTMRKRGWPDHLLKELKWDNGMKSLEVPPQAKFVDTPSIETSSSSTRFSDNGSGSSEEDSENKLNKQTKKNIITILHGEKDSQASLLGSQKLKETRPDLVSKLLVIPEKDSSYILELTGEEEPDHTLDNAIGTFKEESFDDWGEWVGEGSIWREAAVKKEQKESGNGKDDSDEEGDKPKVVQTEDKDSNPIDEAKPPKKVGPMYRWLKDIVRDVIDENA